MGIGKCITMAFSSIMNNKGRSFLTMLGIIIGVAAVIALMSLMNGLTNMITSTFEDMGTEMISVSITARGQTRQITPEEMEDLVDDNPTVLRAVTPRITVGGTVKNGSESVTSSATGVSSEYSDIINLDLAVGRFISYMDVEQNNNVCVIGSYIARELFGTIECLDSDLKINGTKFRVVGVIEESADSEAGSDDDCIYIPYTIAITMSRSNIVNNYTISAVSEETLDQAMAVIKRFCYENLGNEDYYNVISMRELIDMMQDMLGTMEVALVVIAGISLLVAGIGIMNIMLVTVTERTREIGIRKSLGAKKRHIMQQFVIEAGTISSVGGIFGIILGGAMSTLFGKLVEIDSAPSPGAIALAFGVSLSIGLLFGFLPANKAAKLNPIDALRYE